MLALDGVSGRFMAIEEGTPLPVALPAAQRRAADFQAPNLATELAA